MAWTEKGGGRRRRRQDVTSVGNMVFVTVRGRILRPMNKDFVGECCGELFEKQNQQTQILGPGDWPKTRPKLRLHRPSRK